MHIAAHRNWYVCMCVCGCMHAWVHVCAPWHIVFIQCVCTHSCMTAFTFHLIEMGCLCAVHHAGWPTNIGVFFLPPSISLRVQAPAYLGAWLCISSGGGLMNAKSLCLCNKFFCQPSKLNSPSNFIFS